MEINIGDSMTSLVNTKGHVCRVNMHAAGKRAKRDL